MSVGTPVKLNPVVFSELNNFLTLIPSTRKPYGRLPAEDLPCSIYPGCFYAQYIYGSIRVLRPRSVLVTNRRALE
jgi:hypothetical protein